MAGGAPLGNQNAAKSRQFEQAVNRAIAADDGKRLRSSAERLLDLAANGEQWATQMLRDTLDGKPGQAVTVLGDAAQPLLQHITVELVKSEPDKESG